MATLPDLLPHKLLPLHGVDITLRFLAPARLHPFHQPALTAFVRSLLGHPEHYDTLFTLDVPECGRIDYRAGDRYRFTLLALTGAEALLQSALQCLSDLPECMEESDSAMPFRDNLVLVECHDFFRGHPVTAAADLTAYDHERLLEEVDLWQRVPQLRLCWLSPVRLLKHKHLREGLKGEARFCRSAADVSFDLLAQRLYDSVADLLRRRGCQPPPRGPAPPLDMVSSDLFWVDSRYRDDGGREQVMGGLMGEVELAPLQALTPEAWPLWVIGQYLGIGQRRAFGWGRYRLEHTDSASFRRARPATSLLEQVVRGDNLAAAFDAISDNRPGGYRAVRDTDERKLALYTEEWGEQAEDEIQGERLEKLGQRLASGHYRPPPLKGVIDREPDGGLRPLAIPPFWDRVAQRAVAQILTPTLEPLLAHGSFGYRPRRSRLSARQMIQEAYRAGYRWIYESDIEDFFDSVRWTHLRNRLNALYGDDPLVELVMAWMEAPVTYQGHIIQRSAGLPQGSPLSPMLANLMLDDFDSDLETAGFRLARFSDDFVILCKDREEAEAGARAAESSLAEVALRLNRDKTHIRTFAQGFRYLGYLFVNDLVLDVGSKSKHADPEESEEIPPNSWLAHLARRHPRALEETGPVEPVAGETPAPPPSPEASSSPAKLGDSSEDAGAMLFVTGAVARITTQNGRVLVQRNDETVTELPWRGLNALVLIGAHHISTPALRAAMRYRVPVHLASGAGRYQGSAWPYEPEQEGWQLWLAQQAWFGTEKNAVDGARTLVEARLRHQREVLRQRATDSRCDAAIAGIDKALTQLAGVESLNTLNGIEGQATRSYFSGLQTLMPDDWGFNGRNRQPPRDPFNALLSFGYTILYAHVDTVIRASGLLPWIGFYHGSRGRHAALASDLMEPFRHLVERTALVAVTRKRLKLEDFHIDSERGCRLSPEALKLYLTMLAERFDTPVAALGASDSKKLHSHLQAQNLALIAWIRGKAERFVCWRTR